MADIGTLGEWTTLLLLLLAPGVTATILWSPVLVSSRLRTLFAALPITDATAINYGLAAMGLSVPWVVGLSWAFAAIGSRTGPGTVTGEPLLDLALQLGVLYVIGVPLLAGAILPRLGLDWDPTGYGPGTWLRLVVAGTWYALIFAVPSFVFGVIVSLPS